MWTKGGDAVIAHVAPQTLPQLPPRFFQARGSFLGAALLRRLLERPNQLRDLKEAPLAPFARKQKALEALPGCPSRCSASLQMLQARK